MMDDEYIQMCREAVEIQKAWEPKIGDKTVTKWDEIDYLSFVNPTRTSLGDDFSVLTIRARDAIMQPYLFSDSGLFWLPRQEDLQEIYMAPYKGGLHVSTMVNSFYKWFWDEYNDKIKSCLEQYDWNEIWLCFVMTIYNKQWNGKTWELIK